MQNITVSGRPAKYYERSFFDSGHIIVPCLSLEDYLINSETASSEISEKKIDLNHKNRIYSRFMDAISEFFRLPLRTYFSLNGLEVEHIESLNTTGNLLVPSPMSEIEFFSFDTMKTDVSHYSILLREENHWVNGTLRLDNLYSLDSYAIAVHTKVGDKVDVMLSGLETINHYHAEIVSLSKSPLNVDIQH